jgi:chemotaxis protein histidine kinase CheA
MALRLLFVGGGFMSGGFNRSDIVDFFLVEASEHLQTLNDGLLALEENHDDLGAVDEIFRSAHTIKGSAAMLGFNIVSKLAHKMEDLLGKIRNRETTHCRNRSSICSSKRLIP